MSGSTFNCKNVRFDINCLGSEKMQDKPLVWLGTEIKTPPMSRDARVDAGLLLRRLQQGIKLSMPDSRPMPTIGKKCHELRIVDHHMDKVWRVVYRIDSDAIIVVEIFAKKTQRIPRSMVNLSKLRLRRCDQLVGE